MSAVLELRDAAKSFTMHLQGGLRLPVVAGVDFSVAAGQCVALVGPSGAGKSSILKMIFGNYRCDRGQVLVHHGGTTVDVAAAEPRRILRLRQTVMGYVSQFLRAVPRVPALDVVAEPLMGEPAARAQAHLKAAALLQRLGIPERLWQVPPRSPFRAASNSASISHAAFCRSGRCCCCSTSRPPCAMPPTEPP